MFLFPLRGAKMKKDNLNNPQIVPFQTSLDCVTFTISIFWPDCDVDARIPIRTGRSLPNQVVKKSITPKARSVDKLLDVIEKDSRLIKLGLTVCSSQSLMMGCATVEFQVNDNNKLPDLLEITRKSEEIVRQLIKQQVRYHPER